MAGPIKIISGGQTGVDQAALSAALASGIECGGWCPPDRKDENGIIPTQFLLTQTPYERSEKAKGIPRSLRTEWNVRDADATLILMTPEISEDPGTGWTIRCIQDYKKPSLILDPFEEGTANRVAIWIKESPIRILNVAGPSENTCPGIQDRAYNLLIVVFNRVYQVDLRDKKI